LPVKVMPGTTVVARRAMALPTIINRMPISFLR
jgi:hypothetical protein